MNRLGVWPRWVEGGAGGAGPRWSGGNISLSRARGPPQASLGVTFITKSLYAAQAGPVITGAAGVDFFVGSQAVAECGAWGPHGVPAVTKAA